ncbi:protein transport Sec1a-like isoform X2 [Salvia miltiorrhiza]|uniref:protein transport Sec1a-like isoform X2 n=1 Tax=Salvia miltiorrhiza TaxID=226208 RepID=UPI0025AD38A0|nr:protein transport Sec1a-like isoform X2 [Salvia miltiorrhiza]
MLVPDSDFLHAGNAKTFRQISRDRLLYEMLRTSKSGDSRSSWKVLIMDKVTVKVMSCSCKMSDITEQGISLVEDLYRRRQPLPSMDAIYFIQPSKENIIMLLSDMSGREPLYRKAYVYFSSPVPKHLLTHIKNDCSVVPRIAALREMNLEYFGIDNQGFITDHEKALEELFSDDAENSRRFDAYLNEMATRIATVFASLKECPFVHYRAAKGLDGTTVTTFGDLVPTKLAAAVWNIITTYKTLIPNFPQKETCELLIVDRSVDQVAPIIHEWTYDAMCHDLLNLDGNRYVPEVPSKSGGTPEKKEVLLEDHDPVWLEIRHTHIAEAGERLHEKMANFVSKNKAAQMQQRNGSELSTRDLQKMVQALPQYNEQMEKLSVHVEIAGKLNKIIRDMGLRELGQLEQDLVFGDAGTKEVINFLRKNQEERNQNKLRLMMIYATVYPEKFEGDKALKLMQLARLSDSDMKAVKNMTLVGGCDSRSVSKGTFSLMFDSEKRKSMARTDRSGEEETWALFRFYPMIEELIEKLSKGELPKDEYHCMNNPTDPFNNGSRKINGGAQVASTRAGQATIAHSMRSRRTATWARSHFSDDGSSNDSVLNTAPGDSKKMGQRIFVFIIGGATRSELRVCHKLTAKLRREVILGATSLDDPSQYIEKLKLLSEKEVSISNLKI